MRYCIAYSSFFSNMLCGIISSILSVPIIALLKFLRNTLSFPFLCIVFCFTVVFIFLLIKLILTQKTLSKILNNYTSFSQEIQAVYPNKEALIQTLTVILPKAHKVDILDLRGFIFTQQDSPLFSILLSSQATDYRILLSDPNSTNTAFRAQYIPNKPVEALKNEIQASISVIEGLRKNNISLRTYDSHNVFRLIFVDKELFLLRLETTIFYLPRPLLKYQRMEHCSNALRNSLAKCGTAIKIKSYK